MHTKKTLIPTTEIEVGTTELAAALIARWRQIDLALTPIIGRRGIEAIYSKSLILTRAEFPWLVAVSEGELSFDNFTSLQAVFEQQACGVIMAANLALHRTFNKLLVSLIGEPLSERLLQSIDSCFYRDATHPQGVNVLAGRRYA